MKNNHTLTLFALLFKHEKLKIIIWLVTLIGINLLTAYLYPSIYTDSEDLIAFAITMQNPAMKVMLGGGYPPEVYNTALTFAHEMLLFTIIAVAIMNILFATKLMRNDEEEGRVELIKSLPVDRYSYFLASCLVLILINAILILGVGLGLSLLRLPNMTFNGCILYGFTLGMMGLVFASIATLFSQLANNARTASSLSFGLLIIFYIIRGIGDASNEVFLYFSPLGLVSKVLVFYKNNWWPILIMLLIFIVLGLISTYLYFIRDMGSGFINPKKGKIRASNWLKTPFGLFFRLERINIISWILGLFIFAFAFGGILKELDQYFKDMEIIIQFLGPNAQDNFIVEMINYLFKIISLFAVIPCIMIIIRLVKEETRSRIEQIYVRNVSRINYLVYHYIIALITAIIMQMAIVLGLWIAGKNTLSPVMSFNDLLVLGLIYLPSLWVVISLTVFLVGLLPQKSSLIWGYVAFVFIEYYINGLLKIPQIISNISVFSYIPIIPNEDINIITIIILVLVSGLLFVFGLRKYQTRDI